MQVGILKTSKKLKEIISEFKSNGIRTSIFVDPNPKMVEYAKRLEQIELSYILNRLQ